MKKNWELKKLDDVCYVEYGTRVVQKKDGGTIYPVYGGGGATFFMNTFNRKDCLVVARFAMSAQCTRFVKGKFYLNDSGLTVKPKNEKELLSDFLNLQILFLNDHIYSLSRGTAQRNLDVPAFKNIQIAYPKSLPEQKRIVSVLDEAFSAIEQSRKNIERNLQNAKQVFESYLQAIFENKGKNWETKKLGEVLLKTETTDPTKYPDTEFTYLDVSSVNKETKEIENPSVLLGKDAPSRAKKLIKTGDIIFATVRPTHSRVALISKEFDKQVCSTGYFVLRSKENVNNKLIFYFLLTKSFNEEMEKLQKGASYPAVTDNDVKGIYFPFPKSLSEQEKIVSLLDSLRAATQKLEQCYQKQILHLSELKQSLLQQAFSGHL